MKRLGRHNNQLTPRSREKCNGKISRALFAGSLAISVCSADEWKSTSAHRPVAATIEHNQPTLADRFDLDPRTSDGNLEWHIITNAPSKGKDMTLFKPAIDAARQIEYDTGRAIKAGSLDHYELHIASKRIGEACVTAKAIEDALALDRIAKGYTNNDLQLLWLNGDPLCADNKDKVAAYALKKLNATVYKKAYYDEKTIMHETGHLLRMNHHGEIDTPDGASAQLRELEATSGIDALVHYGARTKDGHIDPYASTMTSMGNSKYARTRMERPAFSVIDLNSANPDKFRINQVLPKPGMYDLEYGDDAKLNGIAFAIEDDHPLKKIDKKINDVVIALDITTPTLGKSMEGGYQCDGVSYCEITVTARGEGINYDIPVPQLMLGHTIEYAPTRMNEKVTKMVYNDKHLSITVIAKLDDAASSWALEVLPYEEGQQWVNKQLDQHGISEDSVPDSRRYVCLKP